MTRFVLVTHEPIADKMSGPAIRVLEMGAALTDAASVTIATPYEVARPLPPGVEARLYRFGDQDSLARIADEADVVLIQGFTLYKFPWLANRSMPIVVDLYCPFQLENLERMRLVDASLDDRRTVSAVDIEVVNAQLQRGDFFLCANERQRDLWLGLLMALRRVTPDLYAEDPELKQLLAIVPFGVSSAPPVHSGQSFKASIGVAASDPIILWGGSVLEWQDPETLVEAMPAVVTRVSNARLVFPGGPHPNPEVPEMPVLGRIRERARALGLHGSHVFFVPWIPYDRRADWLLESAIGVSAHRLTLETRYAWRTRMLDYIWAGLPIVCSDGDSFGDLVRQRGLGIAVPPLDRQAMTDALVTLLTDEERRQACGAALAELGRELEWGRVVEPLRRFIKNPRRQTGVLATPAHQTMAAPAAAPQPPVRLKPALRQLFRAIGLRD